MSAHIFMTEAELAQLQRTGRHSPQIAAHVPAAMPEKALLANVRNLATRHGFLVYHTHRSDKSEPGFPDLVLCKPGRLLFIELKSATGKVTEDQMRWLELLKRSVPGVEVYLWRPSDWPSIATILAGVVSSRNVCGEKT